MAVRGGGGDLVGHRAAALPATARAGRQLTPALRGSTGQPMLMAMSTDNQGPPAMAGQERLAGADRSSGAGPSSRATDVDTTAALATAGRDYGSALWGPGPGGGGRERQ